MTESPLEMRLRPTSLAVAEDVPAELAAELASRYVLEARVGGGGMGVVYRARHAVLGRPVALKVLREDIGKNPSLFERLRREAQSASRIDSPHVVSVIDFGTLRTGGYLVMELLEGRDLAQEIDLVGRFEPARAVHVAQQLCDALAAAHDLGIVHRDLKPENVFLVERDGAPDFVKVVDFGLAKVRGAAALTVAGSALGTPQFMAPEQCAGDVADARSDIYALGLVLYHLLTGRLPFEQTSIHQLLLAHLTADPTSPRTFVPELPAVLETIVLRCLAKRREDRYPTMRALRAALDHALGGLPAEAVEGADTLIGPTFVPSPPPPAPPSADGPRFTPPARVTKPREARGRWVHGLLAAALVLAAAGVGAGAFAWVRHEMRAHAHDARPSVHAPAEMLAMGSPS